jgi:hypothetical protein
MTDKGSSKAEELELLKEEYKKKRAESEQAVFEALDMLSKIMMPRLEPYIKAMMRASGINEFQAKTMIYYGLGCYHIDDFDEYPLLTLFGETGTGKTRGIMELEQMLPEWNLIESGATYSDLAKGLDKQRVVVIEEEDKLKPIERCEGLLQDRTQKIKRETLVHIPPHMIVMEIDNWGATILHKRDSFNDLATRNRSIIVKTERKQGFWEVTNVDKSTFEEIAKTIEPDSSFVFEEILLEKKVSSRTLDIWRPIIKVAEACGDRDYLEECKEMLKRELLKVIADDEPLTVAKQALISAYYLKDKIQDDEDRKPDYTKNIKLSEVVNACEDKVLVKMSSQKMRANLRELGYQILFYAGNNWVEDNAEQTQRFEVELDTRGL